MTDASDNHGTPPSKYLGRQFQVLRASRHLFAAPRVVANNRHQSANQDRVMPPTEIASPPCEFVFAGLDGTRVQVNRQSGDSVFNGRLSLSSPHGLLIGIADLHLMRSRIGSHWQL